MYFFLNLFWKKPEAYIRKSFNERHPNSQYAVWRRIKDGSWQVSFDEDQHQAIAAFTEDGMWLWSRFISQFLSLPQNVREAFESQFSKEFIMKVYTVKFKKASLYELLINENDKPKILLFNTSGLLINGNSFISNPW